MVPKQKNSRTLPARCLLAALITGLLCLPGGIPKVAAQEDSANAESSFDAYKIILVRNIFDPKRRAPVPDSERPKPQAPSADRLTLIGVLLSDGRMLAFFDGSRPEFNQVIKLDDSIAGHRIAEIRSDGITLERGGKQTELRVQWGMSKRADEDWTLEKGADASRGGASESSTGAAPAPPSELLKQLMERRKQELGQ